MKESKYRMSKNYAPTGIDYVKDCVHEHQRPCAHLHKLKHRITAAIQSKAPQMLVNAWSEIEYRLAILCATKRSEIDIY
ncbi:hypothetical protein AVEN_199599-1 [Araneus ventricosus]|uniref:Uncharacterized protein n=1 Tax=Araneus ventricosus TaxID=182803 RepID=A0A4Y2SR47_ARAVE|nr:hypothetical protein AVEN_199599-1 [Araneus ventricosus]